MGNTDGNTGRLIVRGGLVVDGSGGAPRAADVEVLGDRIGALAAPGTLADRPGTEVLDARGCIVTPGFIDVHTHYDGQATWSDSLSPSSWHGVTTAVMGNCGVGFAPCHPEQREMLVHLMEGVEDIPEIVLNAGLPWTWRSFPEYLDTLAARRYDVDLIAQIPHAPLRVYVMGERGVRREPATADDRAAMARLVGEAVRAGAWGFSSSRAISHKSRDGTPVPTLDAGEAELSEIGLALRAAGKGVLQFVTDIAQKAEDGVAEFAMLRRVVERSGRPMSMNITQREMDPEGWRRQMRMVADANAAGLKVTGQVMGRAIGLVMGFDLTDHPFARNPSFQALAQLPYPERLARLADPALRASILADQPDDAGFASRACAFDRIFEIGPVPDYEPRPGEALAARAARLGVSPAELAYDLMLARDGQGLLYRPILNYAHGDLEDVRAMLEHPHTVPGVADGGAHYGLVCDASITTFALTYWTRQRGRGPRLALPWLIKRHCADPAAMLGLHDRGRIATGLKADLNVIDYERLTLHRPEVVYDLPGQARRLVQRATGYRATILSGVVTRRDDQATGALPGRLQRS